MLTGLLTHSCLAAAGLSAVVAAHPSLLTGLRFAGATYLAGLGTAALLAWRRARFQQADGGQPARPAGGAALWYGLVLATLAPMHRLLAAAVTRRRIDAVTGAVLLTVAGSVVLP